MSVVLDQAESCDRRKEEETDQKVPQLVWTVWGVGEMGGESWYVRLRILVEVKARLRSEVPQTFKETIHCLVRQVSR